MPCNVRNPARPSAAGVDRSSESSVDDAGPRGFHHEEGEGLRRGWEALSVPTRQSATVCDPGGGHGLVWSNDIVRCGTAPATLCGPPSWFSVVKACLLPLGWAAQTVS